MQGESDAGYQTKRGNVLSSRNCDHIAVFEDTWMPSLTTHMTAASVCRYRSINFVFSLCLLLFSDHSLAQSQDPVFIGLDAEFGLRDSTSAQTIEKGILTAAEEINRAGGVLSGRPLVLKTTDNRSVTARGIKNLRTLAKIPDLVAVFGGRFSPVVIECVPTVHELKLIFLAPWSAADRIIDNGMTPNYVFRLSLRDSLAMPVIMEYALSKGIKQVGLLVPNTSWGRSNMQAVQRYYERNALPRAVASEWFQWGDQSMINKYISLRSAGAEAIIFVANDAEAVFLVRDMANLPDERLMPVISHWGVTGGRFADLVSPALDRVDFSVIQTFSFFNADKAKVAEVLNVTERLFGISRIEEIESPVGFAHAYDLTHILARAIDLAGTTNREEVRDALEQVENYHGLVRHFSRPFSPARHEALGPEDVFMARYQTDGTIRPLSAE
jgi:branched-chain amino acid transport system substrate-binding protein